MTRANQFVWFTVWRGSYIICLEQVQIHRFYLLNKVMNSWVDYYLRFSRINEYAIVGHDYVIFILSPSTILGAVAIFSYTV